MNDVNDNIGLKKECEETILKEEEKKLEELKLKEKQRMERIKMELNRKQQNIIDDYEGFIYKLSNVASNIEFIGATEINICKIFEEHLNDYVKIKGGRKQKNGVYYVMNNNVYTSNIEIIERVRMKGGLLDFRETLNDRMNYHISINNRLPVDNQLAGQETIRYTCKCGINFNRVNINNHKNTNLKHKNFVATLSPIDGIKISEKMRQYLIRKCVDQEYAECPDDWMMLKKTNRYVNGEGRTIEEERIYQEEKFQQRKKELEERAEYEKIKDILEMKERAKKLFNIELETNAEAKRREEKQKELQYKQLVERIKMYTLSKKSNKDEIQKCMIIESDEG